MKNPTIEQIREATLESSPYFFDAQTLRAFGQSLEAFKVVQSPKGNIYIYAPSYWGEIVGDSHQRVNAIGTGYHRIEESNQYSRLTGRNLMGYTFRLFTGSDLKICNAEKDLDSVLKFIENN